jgi:hypothetical protein
MRWPDDPLTRCSNRRTVAEIQGRVVKKGKRNPISRFLSSKNDKDAIAAWRQDLNRILHIFNVRSAGPVWRLLRAHPLDGAVDE